jgi:hypothetical protein
MGRHPIFFLIYLYETQIFLRLNSTLFFQGGKSPHLLKTKNRVQIKWALMPSDFPIGIQTIKHNFNGLYCIGQLYRLELRTEKQLALSKNAFHKTDLP